MAIDRNGSVRPNGTGRRPVNWVAIGIIVFAIAVAALGALADGIESGSSQSAFPTATPTVASPR